MSSATSIEPDHRATHRIGDRPGRPVRYLPDDRGGRAWIGALVLFLASSALYLVHLDRPENPDEFYHVLAARGLLETGEPRIGDGYYGRALLFTHIVARSFALFGESLWSARLPSVFAMALLAAVLFLWVRREAGPLAAWLAAGLYAISPFAVAIAQFCRFYAFQTLAIVLATWLLHDLLVRPAGLVVQLLRLLALALLLAFALHLQETTLIAIFGLAIWAGTVLAWRCAVTPRWSLGRRLAVLLVGGAVLLALLGVGVASGIFVELWERYRSTPLFNMRFRDQPWFYHQWYLLFYPTLWTLTPLLALATLAMVPSLAAMLVTAFAVAFLVSSFAGTKGLRYFAYAQPWLFLLWGIGTARILPVLNEAARHLQTAVGVALRFLGRGAERTSRLLVAGALAAVLVVNPFWLRTFGLIANVPIGPEVPDADWRRALPVLAPLVAEVAIVVGTEELASLYYLGRHDVVFSPSKYQEVAWTIGPDVIRDPRTGLPVIAALSTLESIVRCTPSGVFLIPSLHWNQPFLADGEVIALLERLARPVPLPEDSHVYAYRWRQPSEQKIEPECADLLSRLSKG